MNCSGKESETLSLSWSIVYISLKGLLHHSTANWRSGFDHGGMKRLLPTCL